MRPSPNSSGHGESDSSQRSRAELAAERLEVALEAGELLTLGLDQLRRGLRDETLVRELPSARAISLRSRARSAPTSPFAPPPRSGLTTASKIRFSSPSSGTSTPLRRKVAAARCTS